MGSPARRLTNPITRCWETIPITAMQGQTTDEAPARTLTKTTYADERMLRRFVAAGMAGGFRRESMGPVARRAADWGLPVDRQHALDHSRTVVTVTAFRLAARSVLVRRLHVDLMRSSTALCRL
jgi:hypothetical protein